MNPSPDQVLLARDAQPPVRGPRSEDKGLRAVLVTRFGCHQSVVALGHNAADRLRSKNLDSEPLDLLPDLVRQISAMHPRRESRIVVDTVSYPRLAAHGAALYYQRIFALTRRVEGGR